VDGADAGARLADLVRGVSDHPSAVYEGAFPSRGARTRRGPHESV